MFFCRLKLSRFFFFFLAALLVGNLECVNDPTMKINIGLWQHGTNPHRQIHLHAHTQSKVFQLASQMHLSYS